MPTHLTPAELAARLRIKNVNTLAQWRSKGEGPRYMKFGTRVLYPVAEVEAWESQKIRNSTAG